MAPGVFAPRTGFLPGNAHNFVRRSGGAWGWGGGTWGWGSGFHHRPGFRWPWYSYYGSYGYPFYGMYGYGYPYSYYPYYDPFFGSMFYSDYPSTSNADQTSYANQQLSNQMENLRMEVQQLRYSNQDLQQQISQSVAAAAAAPPSAPQRAAAPEAAPPPTVLVFKDGHRSEISNFAIVGQTLWILSDQRAMRVPLANLDINQTVKANEEHGVAFTVPVPSTAAPH